MAQVNKNRYEFAFLFDCEYGNPNGDPDAGNYPRMDPEDMHGLVSDVAIKRRIRDYVLKKKNNEMPYAIFVESNTNLNAKIARAHEATGGIPKGKKDKATADKEKADAAKKWLCDNFYDIRAFGAVLSTGLGAGQVRGPVQICFARSIDPILPMDIAITRCAITEGKQLGSSEEYEKAIADTPENKLHTMGRKALIPYGLYFGKGFISVYDSQCTGFSEEDVDLLFEAILKMYEHDRSSSKGRMTVRKLLALKHVGNDHDSNQREQQAMLGCAPAQVLFEDIIEINKKPGVTTPRKFADYEIIIHMDKVPEGTQLYEKNI